MEIHMLSHVVAFMVGDGVFAHLVSGDKLRLTKPLPADVPREIGEDVAWKALERLAKRLDAAVREADDGGAGVLVVRHDEYGYAPDLSSSSGARSTSRSRFAATSSSAAATWWRASACGKPSPVGSTAELPKHIRGGGGRRPRGQGAKNMSEDSEGRGGLRVLSDYYRKSGEAEVEAIKQRKALERIAGREIVTGEYFTHPSSPPRTIPPQAAEKLWASFTGEGDGIERVRLQCGRKVIWLTLPPGRVFGRLTTSGRGGILRTG